MLILWVFISLGLSFIYQFELNEKQHSHLNNNRRKPKLFFFHSVSQGNKGCDLPPFLFLSIRGLANFLFPVYFHHLPCISKGTTILEMTCQGEEAVWTRPVRPRESMYKATLLVFPFSHHLKNKLSLRDLRSHFTPNPFPLR